MITIPRRLPEAAAVLQGSTAYPSVRGLVRLYQARSGVLVVTEVIGLPTPDDPCAAPVFGFHVHSGNSCTGNAEDPFADTLTHYDPDGCQHPYHAGDLPPLFGAGGRAFSAVLTDRFTVREVVGRAVIIHAHPDDFMTQPAGNAGMKMACGIISPTHRAFS